MPRYLIFWAILIICCGFALLKGRKYERITAAVFVAAALSSVVGRQLLQVRYLQFDMGEAIVDTAVLIVLVGIALISDRFWPLWAAGLQLVGSMAHLLKAIDDSFAPWGYAVAARFWSYPILIILLIGTWRQYRRSKALEYSVAAE